MQAFSFETLAPPPAAPDPPAGYAELTDAVAVPDPSSLLAAAHAEADAIRSAAYRDGFEQGRADAAEAARGELEPAVQALHAALAAAHEERLLAADAAERQAVELALAIAEKALGAAVEAKPERVLDVVRGALRLLVDRERVVVLVNPADLELLRGAAEELQRSLGGIGHLDVQEERRVARGGVVLRTAVGEVDGSLGTKLDRAREVLLEDLRA
jgi:flagellar assembly protein FliH